MIKKLLSSVRGNVAMTFALAMIPVGGVMALGFDISQLSSAHSKAQNLLDSALLNPFTDKQAFLDQNTVQQKVNEFIQLSNNDTSFKLSNATVTKSGDTWHASATFKTKTLFAGMIGVPEMNGKVDSDITIGTRNLEIVFVLDTSGSMAGARIDALKEAVKKMVSDLENYQAQNINLKIGMVPFTDNVRVDPANANASWMDVNALSPMQDNGFASHVNRWQLLNHLGTSFSGCVMERPNDMDMTDEPPNAGNPKSLFVPWLWPDEPDNDTVYPNSYIVDKGGFDDISKAQDLSKYGINGPNPATWTAPITRPTYTFYSNYFEPQGPNMGCDSQPITPLTANYNGFSTKVDQLNALGGTNLAHGLAWGFKVISPGMPFDEGAAYGAGVQKVIIFFTDGENAVNAFASPLTSAYTPWGYAKDFMPSGSYADVDIKSYLDNKTTQICNNIKAKGIEVYTVGLSIPTEDSKNLLMNCASKNTNFKAVNDASEIGDAFKDIFVKVTELHVSK